MSPSGFWKSARFAETLSQRAEVSWITATTAAHVTDAFALGDSAKLHKFAARYLNHFEFIGKGGLPRKTLAGVRGAKSRRLRCERHRNCVTHSAQQWQHTAGLLFTIGSHGNGAQVRHSPRALGGREIIAAFARERTKTHGRDCRQAARRPALERHSHFGKMKKRFQDQEIHAGLLEESN